MSATLRPADEGAVAAAVRDAQAASEPLSVVGLGSKSHMLRPVQAARVLSTAALTGITLHSPKELVLSARAGTPLSEIEAALAAEGQHLIAEPPDWSQILGGARKPQSWGGMVAANLSGPRRVAWGATRDHVLGIRAVDGTGEVIRSGGRVLKNVTGLDLCKLLTGSYGTLGILTEITVKVLPAPERAGTLVVPDVDAAEGVRVLAAGLGSPFGVSGAAWLPRAGAALVPALADFSGGVALVRVEDFADSVTYRLARLQERLGGDVLDDQATREIWRAIRDAVPLVQEPEQAIWRVSVRPSAGPAVLHELTAHGARGFLDWGGGLVWLAAPATQAAQAAVEATSRGAGGTWTLLRAPEPMRAAVAVIPPEAPALARITRRVKAALDPKGILNPGRMYAGL